MLDFQLVHIPSVYLHFSSNSISWHGMDIEVGDIKETMDELCESRHG